VVLNNVSTNEQLSQRPLLTPDETMRLPPADELVFVAGHAPIYCQKIIYLTHDAPIFLILVTLTLLKIQPYRLTD